MSIREQNFSLEDQSYIVANFLKALGNPHRLQILCLLLTNGEMCVTDLYNSLDTLSQSALSQHLAKMREEGLVSFRREAQTLYYQISDNKTEKVMMVLKEIFCPVTQDEGNEHSNHQCNTGSTAD